MYICVSRSNNTLCYQIRSTKVAFWVNMPKMKLLKLSLVVFLQIYVKSSTSTPSIVIIGAGAAGISAGSKLLKHGFENITILEAENRIGGRINSVFFGDAYVDLGAQWCHGAENNIIYEKVKNLGILRHSEFPSRIYHSSDKNFDEKFGKDLIKIFDELYSPDGHRGVQDGENLGQVCIRKYNDTIHRKYSSSPEKLEIAKSSAELFQHTVIAEEGSFSWFEPSAQSDYTTCGEGEDLNWNGYGYKTILEVLKPKALDHKILLNKEVVSVFTFLNSSLVYCLDGTVLKADHVIFTPSVGVLKRNHQKMFYPSLPKSKIQAIETIGFDAVAKIVMHFKIRWWKSEKSFNGFKLLWSEQDKMHASEEFQDGLPKEGQSWVTQVYEVIPAERNPNVLIAWVTGTMVPKIELLSNNTIARGLEYILKKFLGHKYKITAPDEILKSTWYTNPHFRGTYSFQTVKARTQKVKVEKELAKPIMTSTGRPLIQFAGEASHPYYFSTVHGAIETGFREAHRIIDLYK